MIAIAVRDKVALSAVEVHVLNTVLSGMIEEGTIAGGSPQF
jgi:hypothetical protein